MSILHKIFRQNPAKHSAAIAKERLKIIVAHERGANGDDTHLDFLPKLQKEIVDLISKYVEIDSEQVKIDLDQAGNNGVLELNITLPEKAREKEEVA